MERSWRPNGEVRGSNLIGGRAAGSSGDWKCFSCGEMGHSKENVRKRINLGVARVLNKEARYHRG